MSRLAPTMSPAELAMLRAATGGQEWHASPAQLARQREARRRRRFAVELVRGDIRKALIEEGHTQERYRMVTASGPRNTERVVQLVSDLGVLDKAYWMMAGIVAGQPITVQLDEAYQEQSDAIDAMQDRCLWDQTYKSSVYNACIEDAVALRVSVHAGSGPSAGVVVTEESLDDCMPLGERGPDGQPTVWERRWIVERTIPGGRTKQRYLRVERHRAPGGVGLVEQRVYKARSSDTLVDTATLEEVDLSAVLEPGSLIQRDTLTRASYPMVVELAHSIIRGRPAHRLKKSDISLVDHVTGSSSQIRRSHAMHASPKMRIVDSMIDPQTGKADVSQDTVVDPDKEVEYIIAQLKTTEMIEELRMLLHWLLITSDVAPALLGIKTEGGAAPDSYDKLRLQTTTTRVAAMGVAGVHEPALARLMYVASQVQSALPMQGWAVDMPDVKVNWDIPRDQVQVARDLAEIRGHGLSSEIRTLTEYHGSRVVAEEVLAEIEAERASRAASQARALGLEMGIGAGGGL